MQADLSTILQQLRCYLPKGQPRRFVERCSYSNRVTEVWFDNRRVLIIKSACHPVLNLGLGCERAAVQLLKGSAIAVPQYLPGGTVGSAPPYLAYWRIPLPTLLERWPSFTPPQRRTALRSLGVLIRALHRIRLSSFGRLPRTPEQSATCEAFLHDDLAHRLLPAVRFHWPSGVPLACRLIEYIPKVAERAEGQVPVLTHGDLFSGNVLCESRRGRCAGLIDLEDASANLPEADFARLQLLHGPAMGHPWSGDWFEEVLVGYAARPDPMLLRFFTAYHLINFAFHAALTGRSDIAARLLEHAHEGWSLGRPQWDLARAICAPVRCERKPDRAESFRPTPRPRRDLGDCTL